MFIYSYFYLLIDLYSTLWLFPLTHVTFPQNVCLELVIHISFSFNYNMVILLHSTYIDFAENQLLLRLIGLSPLP
jgi:hypothetical protein